MKDKIKAVQLILEDNSVIYLKPVSFQEFEETLKTHETSKRDPDQIIYVNGLKRPCPLDIITYSQLVILAVEKPELFPDITAYRPFKPGEVFTVQYCHGPPRNPSGTLTLGQQVKVQNGMVFDVVKTDNA